MTTSFVLTLLVFVNANPSPSPDPNAAEKRLRYLASRLDAMVEIKEKENTLGLLLTDLADQVSEPDDKQKPAGFEKRVIIVLDLPRLADAAGGKFEPEVFQIKFSTPMRVSLRAALQKVCDQLPGRIEPACIVVRGDYIELATALELRRELNYPYGPEYSLRQLVVEFYEKIPLASAFRELEKKHNCSIVVSPLAEKTLAQSISARLVNVPLDTAVDVLADLVDLKVVRKANVYFLTTREQAASLIAEEEKRLRAEKKTYKKTPPLREPPA